MIDNRVSVLSNENRVDAPVYAHDKFTLTESGTAQIQSGATRLPSEALALLVMLDGKRTVGDLEQLFPALTPQTVRDGLRALLSARLVREVTLPESAEFDLDFTNFFNTPSTGAAPSPGTQASANREAVSGTSQLERNGYYVSIARQALKARSVGNSSALFALLVEDDPDMASLVTKLLQRAGIASGVAGSRDAVLQRLRNAPPPDLILLDVMLPDLNGFDLLRRLKLHPVLKTIPVVMLTADAARESIVNGLTIGADGYITKPFAHDVLLRGVKAVLGIAA